MNSLYTKYLLFALLLFICSNQLIAQDINNETPNKYFEDYLPIYPLKCGLWANSNGDIAYKDKGLAPPKENGELSEDIVDYFIQKTYDGNDSINDYEVELRNIVDTLSFQILGGWYFKDKNRVYLLNSMAYGGYWVVYNGADLDTFHILSDTAFACDKNYCFVVGRLIEVADPETFQVVPNNEHRLLSRDENHLYDFVDIVEEDE